MERKCNRCGACCQNPTLELRPPQYPYFEQKDGWVDLGMAQGNKTVGKIGECDYLGKNNGTFECAIYERRPVICEVYECKSMKGKKFKAA
ncbi:MAG: YkgJ family cysteine cluster protein [Patescibacteria group bacterium]|nr:YkgJ family cysteine cluster protein [Patescibacteria group bacterium]